MKQQKIRIRLKLNSQHQRIVADVPIKYSSAIADNGTSPSSDAMDESDCLEVRVDEQGILYLADTTQILTVDNGTVETMDTSAKMRLHPRYVLLKWRCLL